MRDAPVIFAVSLTYVLIRISGVNPIFLSLFVGFLSPLVFAVFSRFVPDAKLNLKREMDFVTKNLYKWLHAVIARSTCKK